MSSRYVLYHSVNAASLGPGKSANGWFAKLYMPMSKNCASHAATKQKTSLYATSGGEGWGRISRLVAGVVTYSKADRMAPPRSNILARARGWGLGALGVVKDTTLVSSSGQAPKESQGRPKGEVEV